MESFSEEVGLKTSCFSPYTDAYASCVTFNKTRTLWVIWRNFYCRRCTVIYPTPETFLTTGLGQISVAVLRKIVFPQLLPIFYWSAIILSRYYRFPHYMRLRQFTSFNLTNPMESNYPTLPSPLAPNPLPLLLACEQALSLGKRVKKTSWFFQITLSPNRQAFRPHQ